jgi:hypothetical protein
MPNFVFPPTLFRLATGLAVNEISILSPIFDLGSDRENR